MIDTAVIWTCYGRDPRVESDKMAFFQCLKQDLPVVRVFVELITNPSRESRYPFVEGENIRHIKLYGSEVNENMFQKEALQNIGADYCKDCKYLIFVDGDVFSEDLSWYRKIREKLLENPDKLVQGFRTMKDTQDKELDFFSMVGCHKENQWKIKQNPGVCWAMNRSFFEEIEGFNPWCVPGSGDSGFVAEFLNMDSEHLYDKFASLFFWWKNVMRFKEKKGEMDYINVHLIHCFHGTYTERAYIHSRKVADRFGGDIRDLVKINKDGFLEWKNPGCVLQRVFQKWKELIDYETTENIVKKAYIDSNIKIIHTINLNSFINSQRLRQMQDLTLKSIDVAKKINVVLIGCIDQKDEFNLQKNWKIEKLNRNAITEFGFDKDLPFLKDVLDSGAKYATYDDWLIYTNTDCPISQDFYENLRKSSANAVIYYRQELPQMISEPEDLSKYFTDLAINGMDGFAMRGWVYQKYRELIPDFVLGGPEWDSCMFQLLRIYVNHIQLNVNDLYHVSHKLEWNYSNKAARHNLREREEHNCHNNKISDLKDFTNQKERENRLDTSVIIISDNNNPLDVCKVNEKIIKTVCQTMHALIVVVEKVSNLSYTKYPLLERYSFIEHVRVLDKGINTEDLYQKGILHSKKCKYIFILGVCNPKNKNWLIRARLKLVRDQNGEIFTNEDGVECHGITKDVYNRNGLKI